VSSFQLEHNVWISRHPLNNSLVVFIHGIWGSRWSTWKSYVDFFQRIPTEKPLIRNYDVYLFNYKTNKIRQPPLRPTVVRDLRIFLAEQNEKYETIVLVCHSQGGLVAKIYLLEELRRNRGKELKVDMILTLNSPHRGANWRHWAVCLGLLLGLVLKKLWVIDKFFILRQLADMAPNSENIQFLRDNWGFRYISPYPNEPATESRRYIRTIAISGLKDRLVSKASAEGYDVDDRDANFSGHGVDSDEVAAIVGYYLSQHEKPTAVTRELVDIYMSADLFNTHKQHCLANASQIINLYPRKWFSADYIDRRAGCFVDDFFDAFMRRPLRKLKCLDAFKAYVKRTLQD
jgi:pimeloyl-ACP methyl ester carboxylesterase